MCLALDKGRKLRGNHVLGVGLRYGGALHRDAARTSLQVISLGRWSELDLGHSRLLRSDSPKSFSTVIPCCLRCQDGLRN